MDLEIQYDRIYRYCYFRLHNAQIAEDITQETFLRFFNKDLSLDSSRELLSVLITICYLVSGISLLQIGVYLFVPYLLTANISLYIVRHFRNKETIYWCMAIAVLVSGANISLHYLADFLFQTNYLVLWIIVTLILIIAVVRELYQMFKKTEGFIWNFVLTD